jgi:hypothetical protein
MLVTCVFDITVQYKSTWSPTLVLTATHILINSSIVPHTFELFTDGEPQMHFKNLLMYNRYTLQNRLYSEMPSEETYLLRSEGAMERPLPFWIWTSFTWRARRWAFGKGGAPFFIRPQPRHWHWNSQSEAHNHRIYNLCFVMSPKMGGKESLSMIYCRTRYNMLTIKSYGSRFGSFFLPK